MNTERIYDWFGAKDLQYKMADVVLWLNTIAATRVPVLRREIAEVHICVDQSAAVGSHISS